MDIVEKLNKRFGGWYERLFGEEGNTELRPKDVLRKILHAMDDNRSEGLDGKTYVPNCYVLELSLGDNDERDYLLSFLDEEELTAVLQRYMAQNGYATRGPLDFTITERDGDADPTTAQPNKLTVKARYQRAVTAPSAPEADSVELDEEPGPASTYEDMPTVASIAGDDLPTVASLSFSWGTIAVTQSDGHRSLVTLSKPSFSIGRSRNSENDLVLATDGQVSKRHARIDHQSDGQVVVFDLGSTNGVLVNERRIAGSAALKDGDIIRIGEARLEFKREQDSPAPASVAARTKARLLAADGVSEHLLASETLVGRSITCDLVLDDPSAATRQAQIILNESGRFNLESLSDRSPTMINDRVLYLGERTRLTNGDRIQFGREAFQYLEKVV